MIYFTDTEGRGIYSVRGRDLKGIRQLYEGPVEGLNVAGEYFYFVSPSDRKLYRLRTDGTELVKLSEQDASAPLVWGKSLLFLEGASSSRVMKIDLSAWESGGDGEAPEDRDAREAGEAGEPVALTRTAVKHYAADGEWLYFCGIGNSGLFRVPLGGEDSGAGSDVVLEEQIATGNISDVVVDEFSRLYFLRNEGKEIVSSANDGSDLQVLSEEPAAYLTYGNRKLYYVSWTPHSLSLTGRESQTLASNLSEELSVLSEWIFSIGYEAEGVLHPQIFTFRPDGTEWAILSMGE